MSVTTSHPIDPQALKSFLEDGAARRLQEYFHSGDFTGGRFESFEGGGDRPDVVDTFDAGDVVAVSLLSVRIPGRAALQILDSRRDEIGQLLSAIPADVDLWDASSDVIGPGSPADELWSVLEDLPGSGWVTAGKLLARKRPRLIPIYDRVVKAALQRPKDDVTLWQDLQATLRADSAIIDRLKVLHAEISPNDASLLRMLDVAIWMKAHGRPEPDPPADADL